MTCRVPGCRNKLVKGCAEVCKGHLHRRQYCQCRTCKQRRGEPVVGITLPKFPWREVA